MSYSQRTPKAFLLLLPSWTLPIGALKAIKALNRLLDKLRNSMKPKHTIAVVRLNGQENKMLADNSPHLLQFLRRVLVRRDVHMVQPEGGNDVHMEETVYSTATCTSKWAQIHAIQRGLACGTPIQGACTTVVYTGHSESAVVADYVLKAAYGTKLSWLKSFRHMASTWCQAQKDDNE